VPTYVVLLRAVNVGGRQLKMADAREVLSHNGFMDVQSHIQTGNFLLGSTMRSDVKVEDEVARVLSEHAGFPIVAVARKPAEVTSLVEAVDGIPPLEGSTARYVTFLTKAPAASAARELEAWDAEGERAHVIGKDVLVDFAVPYHAARLTGARIEKVLGVEGTARNLTVVRKLAERWGQ
jgi:uncharacterized protein (DUF1697 family)